MPGAKKHFFEPSQSFPILFNKFKGDFRVVALERGFLYAWMFASIFPAVNHCLQIEHVLSE